MSTAPSDLRAWRLQMLLETGLTGSDVGIVGDGAHQKTGGYHEGMDVLVQIGRYHPPATAHIGEAGEDYSARLRRDRAGLTDDASAADVGSAWSASAGGQAAWLRFNQLLVAALQSGDPALAAVRAINYTVDGRTRHRRDRQRGLVEEASTDTVLTHTHMEFYRDTAGRRSAALDRILELVRQAKGGDMLTLSEMYGKLTFEAWSPTREEWIAAGGDPAAYDRMVTVGGSAENVLAQLVRRIDGKVATIGDQVDRIRADQVSVTLTPEDRAAIISGVAAEVTDSLAEVSNALAALADRLAAAGRGLAGE